LRKLNVVLVGGKQLYLSKGGKITLIISTLSNFPTYFLSLFPILGVANGIEKIQQVFLWSRVDDEFIFYLVSWSNVYTPISSCGLGLGICFFLTELFWGSGYGIMPQRERERERSSVEIGCRC